jgi:hypothetical protein
VIGSWVVAGQVELVAEQSGAVTTVPPVEATLKDENGQPDGRSAGAWAESAAWTHFGAYRFEIVRFFREKLAG